VAGEAARLGGAIAVKARVIKARLSGEGRPMRNLISAVMAVGIGAMPVYGHAAKNVHKAHHVVAYRGTVVLAPDPTGGNAAAGGNNANSMSGSNSAVENANGRTSGSGWGG